MRSTADAVRCWRPWQGSCAVLVVHGVPRFRGEPVPWAVFASALLAPFLTRGKGELGQVVNCGLGGCQLKDTPGGCWCFNECTRLS